ncbi:hypothetical protein HGB44_30500 [Nocardiopsis dassonvillei subsp. albirubida]|uniref:NmrA family transcriptional regulator n=2 Tax=Nocardiopsis alborubida TaxID=146802 RepID=A0A7X6MJ46_9ACTN|nr:hypothetical protein [Nocardiopsis alborubida]
MTNQSTFLVTAGRGTTGRRVVRIRRGQGFAVRAASRSFEQYFAWLDQSSWGPALEGVDAVYLVPFDPVPLTPAFVRSAVETGVRRIVRGFAEEDARSFGRTLSPIRLGPDRHLSDGVWRALGREPRDFTDFVQGAGASGAWSN